MKLLPRSVTAIIPTRGDVDMREIQTGLLNYPEVSAVWVVVGTTPFNRYLAAAGAPAGQVVYTQDDDCITNPQELFDNYRPGWIINAMTEQHAANYPGRQTLLGFGALFAPEMARELCNEHHWERDKLFLRESDRVMGTIWPHQSYFPEIRILPCANWSGRLWKQTEHVPARVAIEKRILEKTGWTPR